MRFLPLIWFFASSAVMAQVPGSLDHTFNATDVGNYSGDGPNGAVYAQVLQPDGKILISKAGHFYNNIGLGRLVRVDAAGVPDVSFGPVLLDVSGYIHAMAVQADGRIVIAGDFTTVNYVPRAGVARLNSDGTLDTSFGSANAMDPAGWAHALLIQPDGKIVIAGVFVSFDGLPCKSIVRLDANGVRDPGFDLAQTFPSGYLEIRTLALLPDGRILAGGRFGSANVIVERLLTNGSVDPSYSPPTAIFAVVRSMAITADGGLIIVGDFSDIGGVARPGVAKLLPAGLLDPWNAEITAGDMETVALQPDGKIIVAGHEWNNSVSVFVRLHGTGARDWNFSTGSGPWLDGSWAPIWAISILSSGKVVVGGAFSRFHGVARQNLACLSTSGAVDLSFLPGSGANWATVRAVALQSNGKVLIAGDLRGYNGTARDQVARLNTNGSLDATFVPGTGGTYDKVHAVLVQPNSAILIGGDFEARDNVPRKGIARLLSTGALDTSFDPGSGVNGVVYAMALQPDGKILIAGAFFQVNGTPRACVARLNVNGSLDATFDPGSGPSSAVLSMALQPDGKILLGGAFNTYAGVPRARIVRVLANGTLDSTFDPGTGADGNINAIAVQPDGKILIGGGHESFNGTVERKLTRLLTTGAVDPSFGAGTGFPSGCSLCEVYAIALQQDGRIIVGGYFFQYDGATRIQLARLEQNGQLDPYFDPQSGVLGATIMAIGIQTDGNILIGGGFGSYAGTGRNRVARVFGGGTTMTVFARPRVHLGGCFTGTTMTNAMNAAGLAPLGEPYTTLGYVHASGGGAETTSSIVMTAPGTDAIVDWVLVELRSAGTVNTRLASRSALVQRDGDVVGMDGVSPISFIGPAGNYHIAIRHRNHLGVMTASPIALLSSPTTIDFTNGGTPTYGTNAQKNVNGTMVLWPGDVNFDGTVKYAGASNDRDPILTLIGGTTPTSTVSNVYNGADLNLDGQVKYAGGANDRDIILQTIGGSVPTATRAQQLP